ncbi:hypothetical protein GFU50_18275 (plasmid) [Enterococcus casseliflavus]|uniref:Phage protein n=2 Tax=Enterococcus casseliflavus TaxID=37734 RepID=A0ABD6Z576_ENTCA|nr:hypothetical protein GFU50_17995 [Enterococcus casseliflavus]QGN31425.1 hypothetical protein GFU50_18275 [Enterococcus casseliflavus]
MVIIYVKRVNGSIRRSMEEINLSWSNQMKNDVGGKLISLEARREKVWTVIVFNHFSKELMGFLSNAATVENLQFTQRKEELGIFKENEANAILDAILELKDEEDVIRKTFTDSGHVDWVSGTYFDFEIAKVTFE